jgi:SAM-dependent methyltransferase
VEGLLPPASSRAVGRKTILRNSLQVTDRGRVSTEPSAPIIAERMLRIVALLLCGSLLSFGAGVSDTRSLRVGIASGVPTARFLRAGAQQQSLAPYVPTPHDVVNRMLTLAKVTKDDVVYDLGCGDGRIVIAAAKQYGARGVGVDIDPIRIEESVANAKAAGVEELVEFRLQDALTVNVSPATVVTLYLLSSSNAKLRPVLTRQLRPGARIIAHAFSMGPSWPADEIDRFTSVDGNETTLYLWIADGKVRP